MIPTVLDIFYYMMRLLTLLLICSFPLSSCAPTRPPIPVGSIPTYREVSTTDEQYGHTVLNELSKQYPIDYNDSRLNNVTEIVDTLALAGGAKNDPWHVFILSGADVKNAAATRGNHIFIWTGMLDLTKNNDELAAILSHEMAHLLAGHTDPDPNEQVKKILIGAGAMAAGIAVAAATNSYSMSGTFSRITSSITEGVGEEALINPYSRERELEADHIGLMLMARAGYDPNNAILFWERMMNDPVMRSDTAFFSSHPTTKERIDNLKKTLPIATQAFGKQRQNKNQNITSSSLTRPPSISLKPSKDLSSSTGEKEDIWIITSHKAKLYRAPSPSSPAIGDISKGGKVVVIDSFGDWLVVSDPDIGYLKATDARQERSETAP